ncbi:division/cell wall cluster transcriptional repressor MraZ [Azohydromonas caseinilytica]|uniref:Transcriptional regulator MraZ n=1 Tax=Azohydromonas caseinilytica TaxID=2728836 RepID=A0A848FGK8_9BURK|nr:division/cell wall cluster transcriptional repressor MraZ [Azohydromonas caseinilytica]NML18484.1 division/cell wall cluster transcriptional repressor MraZ [Azohydromonas caseinilytica]
MAGHVFQGPAALTLDGKGRLTVPARHRDALMDLSGGQLTLTKSPAGCLFMFPRPAWEQFRDKLLGLPMAADGWRRVFLGNALDVDMDSASRVLVAPELREAAGLVRDVMLIGMGSRLELWDRARLAAHEAQVMSSEMPAAIQDFVA